MIGKSLDGFVCRHSFASVKSLLNVRIIGFQSKLYLEFGGKLVFDYHASRILPGFDPNVKIRLLQRLRDRAEIILCIYAGDIERKKVRADFGITYDSDMLRLIDDLREWGLSVAGVVITRFNEQPAAVQFKNRLDRRGVKTYIHRSTKGYPTDVDMIASDEGYGANPYIETTKPIVVVSAPGPGSGKMGTCLSQLYHDHKRGLASGYSKFETFPIWNLPLKHPVNIAYEAATADLCDFNMVDSFHLEAHGEASVNYNRDVEIFPVLKRILERITGEESIYQSATDMGVNRAGFAISATGASTPSAVRTAKPWSALNCCSRKLARNPKAARWCCPPAPPPNWRWKTTRGATASSAELRCSWPMTAWSRVATPR